MKGCHFDDAFRVAVVEDGPVRCLAVKSSVALNGQSVGCKECPKHQFAECVLDLVLVMRLLGEFFHVGFRIRFGYEFKATVDGVVDAVATDDLAVFHGSFDPMTARRPSRKPCDDRITITSTSSEIRCQFIILARKDEPTSRQEARDSSGKLGIGALDYLQSDPFCKKETLGS